MVNIRVLGDSVVLQLCKSTAVCDRRCAEAAPKVELQGPGACFHPGTNSPHNHRLIQDPKEVTENAQHKQAQKKERKSIQIKVSLPNQIWPEQLGSTEERRYSINITDASMQV